MTGLIPQLMGPAIESSNPQSSHPAHPPSARGSGFGCRLATFLECTLTFTGTVSCPESGIRCSPFIRAFTQPLTVGAGRALVRF